MKLSKKEEHQLQLCLERVRDCQFRLSDCREFLVKRGWIINGLPDAIQNGYEALERTESLIMEIQKGNFAIRQQMD